MIQSIEKLLSEARVARFDPEDGTLSSGERAQAKIVTVLLEEWDALDGKQQRTIVDVLEKSTQATEDAEAYARAFAERLRQRAKK